MDLRQYLILISGHLTDGPHPGRARRIGNIVPNENISFGSVSQQPVPMREQGIASPREQAAAAPGDRLFDLARFVTPW
jgi:hypothetical protein